MITNSIKEIKQKTWLEPYISWAYPLVNPNKTKYLENEILGCLIKLLCPDITECYFANSHFVGITEMGAEDVPPPHTYFKIVYF